MKALKVYVAGKVAKDSFHRTHYWRDEFLEKLSKLSGRKYVNYDPTKTKMDQSNPENIFEFDCFLISQADVLIAYLSDDISVGCSQEVLIAKYFKKPVIALAPHGGKFNGRTAEYFGQTIKEYKDPFVFSTCDVVCSNIEEVAEVIKNIDNLKIKNIELIGNAAAKFVKKQLPDDEYLKKLLDPT